MGIQGDSLSTPIIDIKDQPLMPIEESLLGVLKEGSYTRKQLVKRLGIPRTTIYDGLKKLIRRELASKSPLYVAEQHRGRPQVIFFLVAGKK